MLHHFIALTITLVSLVTSVSITLAQPSTPQPSSSASSGFTWSGRTGNQIDAAERTYFGLFPSRESFGNASITPGADSSIIITITRADDGRADTTLTLSKEAATELRRYVEEYEALFRDGRQLRWELLRPFIRPNYYPLKPSSVEVLTRDGKHHRGDLVIATPEGIALLAGHEPYDWQRMPERLMVLHYSQIEHLEQAGARWYFIGGGAALGTMVAWLQSGDRHNTVFESIYPAAAVGFLGWGLSESVRIDLPIRGNRQMYDRVADDLADLCAFEFPPAPELRAMVAAKMAEPGFINPQPAPTVEEILADYPLPRLHVWAEQLLSVPVAKNRAVVEDLSVMNAGTREADGRIAPLVWSFGADYSIIGGLRLGGRYSIMRPLEPSQESFDDYVAGNVAAVTASYAFVEPDPLYRTRLELAAVVGVSYNDLIALGTVRNTRKKTRDTLYYSEPNLIGATLGVRAGFHATRNVSVTAGFEYRWVPTLTLGRPEEVRAFHEFVREHTMELSSVSTALGFQLHW